MAAQDRRPNGPSAYDPEVTILKWSTSMARRKPKTFVVGVLASLLGLVIVLFLFRDYGAVILAAVLLGGALGPLYLPTSFTFTNKKAYYQVFFSREGYRWQDFDGYRLLDDGVYLHLRPVDLRMRYLKGMNLFFGPGNREQVLDVIRQHVATEAGAPSEAGKIKGTSDDR